jgi:hypothetical protein
LPACARFTRVPIQYPVRDSTGLRGKVPINIDLSLLLVPDNSSCRCSVHVHRSQSSILLGISQQQAQRSQSILTCRLLLVPDNSSCCLHLHALYLGPNPVSVRDFATAGLKGQGPNQLTCQACCWSLITAAVAAWVRCTHRSQSSIMLGIRNSGARVRGKVPIRLVKLADGPDNSSCCLHGCRYTRVPIQYP